MRCIKQNIYTCKKRNSSIICVCVRCQSEDHPISIPTWHNAIEFIYLRLHQHHKRYWCNTDVYYTSECFDTGTVIYQTGWNCCEGVGIGVDINGLTWSGHFWRSWRSITDAHGSLTERTSNQPMKLRVLKPIVIPPYKIVSNAFHQRTPIKLHHLCWQQMSKMLSIRSSNLM